jgi:serine/threonine protein kinase
MAQGLDHSRYTKQQIGSGGQGTVFHYVDSQGVEDLAVKRLNLQQAEGWETIDRLKREAKLLGKLGDHPNIVGYRGFEEEIITTKTGEDTLFYLITPWIEGDDLAKVMGEKKLADGQLENILDQTISGLRYAHEEAGVIHRDVKPSNLMLQPDRLVKIIDWGVSKTQGDTTMTLGGVGTQNYWAPEIWSGDKQTHESDLYAVGVTMVEMLAGKSLDRLVTPERVKEKFSKMKFVNDNLRNKVDALLSENPEERRYWERSLGTELAVVEEKGLLKDYVATSGGLLILGGFVAISSFSFSSVLVGIGTGYITGQSIDYMIEGVENGEFQNPIKFGLGFFEAAYNSLVKKPIRAVAKKLGYKPKSTLPALEEKDVNGPNAIGVINVIPLRTNDPDYGTVVDPNEVYEMNLLTGETRFVGTRKKEGNYTSIVDNKDLELDNEYLGFDDTNIELDDFLIKNDYKRYPKS